MSDLLATLRAFAAEPGALFYVLHGRVTVWVEDIRERDDDALLALVESRLAPTTIHPCQCGQTPAYVHTSHSGGAIQQLRLTCVCGHKGAALLYSKPEDEAYMRQAGIDGWNMAHA